MSQARRQQAGLCSRYRLFLCRLTFTQVGVEQEFIPNIEENFPSLKVDTRILGPWRSPRIATDAPVLRQSHELYPRAFCDLRRAVRKVHTYNVGTRRDNFFRLLSRSVAGPNVVTIFVLRSFWTCNTPLTETTRCCLNMKSNEITPRWR